MKRTFSIALTALMLFSYTGMNAALAIQSVPGQKALQAAPNARTIELAFVFDGPVFKKLEANREDWAMNDRYLFPGAIQYFGPSSVCDITAVTLALESAAKLATV